MSKTRWLAALGTWCSVLSAEHVAAFALAALLVACFSFQNSACADAPADPFAGELNELAQKCEELGLAEQAAITSRWYLHRRAGHEFLFRPEIGLALPKADAPERVKQWFTKFQAVRAKQAESLVVKSKAALGIGRADDAYRYLFEALREDPDQADARRVLGYKRLANGQWSLGNTPPSGPVAINAPLPGLGGPAVAHVKLTSPHFEIHFVRAPGSAKPRMTAEALRDQLEETRDIWRQMFFEYWASDEALRDRLAGGTKPLEREKEPPPHKVVLFATREQFLAALGKGAPGIVLAAGFFAPKVKVSYFYCDDNPKIIATYRHEATHQLFQETLKTIDDPGAEANAWFIEGAALYMESLQKHDTFYTLGGCDADRLQFARYRALAGDFSMPLAELILLNREKLQAHPDIRKLYSHSAGLAQFLLEGAEGRYRPAVVAYLTAIYRGEDTAETLPKLLKTLKPPATLADIDAEYRKFLNVTDDDLAGILAPEKLRTLSLGRTQITDKGLASLQSAKNLEWLDLSGTEASDDGLAHFSAASKLTQLFLDSAKISDASTPLIARFKDLEELDLSNTSITDAGLPALVGLKKLKILYLSGTGITDTGIKSLKALKTLESIDLERTKVTPAALADLRKALPRLKSD